MLLYRDDHDSDQVHIYDKSRDGELAIATIHMDSICRINGETYKRVRDASRMDFPLKVNVKIELEEANDG